MALCMIMGSTPHAAAARSKERPVVIRDHTAGSRPYGHWQELDVDCELLVDRPGTYSFFAQLRLDTTDVGSLDSSELAIGLVRAAGRMHGPTRTAIPSDDVTTDDRGRLRFTVIFDQLSLWRLKTDGPWTFRCEFCRLDSTDRAGRPIPSAHPACGYFDAPTREWRRRQFGPPDPEEIPRMGLGERRHPEKIVYDDGLDLVVATVTGGDSAGTNAAPPRVGLEVEACLYGARPRGPLEARWLPGGSGIWCPVGEGARIRRWLDTPLPTPAVGTRWILGGKVEGPRGEWQCRRECRWPYSDSLRAHFVKVARTWPGRARANRRAEEVRSGRR